MIPILPPLKLSDLKSGDNVRVLDEASDFYGMIGVFRYATPGIWPKPSSGGHVTISIPVAATTEKGAWKVISFPVSHLMKVDRVLAPP